jgi:hypothetical protein
MESRSRSILVTPLEPVIGLAEGETRWRGMTGLCGAATRAYWLAYARTAASPGTAAKPALLA